MSAFNVHGWLCSILEKQIAKLRLAMENVVYHLENNDWKNASESHRNVDYWMSRCKNTQRLIDELEEV